MNRLLKIFTATLLLVVATACQDAAGPMLHTSNSYAGPLSVTPESGAPWSCDLAFDRGNGNLQAKITSGARVITLVRGADGKPSAFEKAVERPVTVEEARRYALVRDLTEKRSIENVQPGAESYRVKVGGRWLTVVVDSQTGTPFHGHPR